MQKKMRMSRRAVGDSRRAVGDSDNAMEIRQPTFYTVCLADGLAIGTDPANFPRINMLLHQIGLSPGNLDCVLAISALKALSIVVLRLIDVEWFRPMAMRADFLLRIQHAGAGIVVTCPAAIGFHRPVTRFGLRAQPRPLLLPPR